MPTRPPTLTDDDGAFLVGLVANGRFPTPDAALAEAVTLLRADEARADALLARIMVGYEQAERGEFVEGSTEEIFERAFARAAARWEARQRAEGLSDDAA